MEHDKYMREEIREARSEARENVLQSRISALQSELEDLRRLSAIAMEIVGKPPHLQRGIGTLHKFYAGQNELPNVRDFVLALLRIPERTDPNDSYQS